MPSVTHRRLWSLALDALLVRPASDPHPRCGAVRRLGRASNAATRASTGTTWRSRQREVGARPRERCSRCPLRRCLRCRASCVCGVLQRLWLGARGCRAHSSAARRIRRFLDCLPSCDDPDDVLHLAPVSPARVMPLGDDPLGICDGSRVAILVGRDGGRSYVLLRASAGGDPATAPPGEVLPLPEADYSVVTGVERPLPCIRQASAVGVTP